MWFKILLFLIFSLPAWSYQLTQDFKNGFYWSSLPVSITVIEADEDRKKLLEDLSIGAIQEWESRTGLSLWDFNVTDSIAQSRNIIRWSKNFAAETKMDPKSVLAVAIRYTDGPYYAKTEIVINGGHELNSYEHHLRTTLTHELGHTMGLDHSEEEEAVMAPTLQAIYYGLHEDDVSGLTDAHDQTEKRQLTGYVSPLSYEKTTSQEPVSCGTIGVATPQTALQGFLSLISGILIAFVRKVGQWFKSLCDF